MCLYENVIIIINSTYHIHINMHKKYIQMINHFHGEYTISLESNTVRISKLFEGSSISDF